jgi:hypothetical protein
MTGHDCPPSTRNRIRLWWSDREAYVENVNEIVDVIVDCALDHYYDRDKGVPNGLPERYQQTTRRIVEKHLSTRQNRWLSETVDFSFSEKAALRAELTARFHAIDNDMSPVEPSK